MIMCVALAHGLTKSAGQATLNQRLQESEGQEKVGEGDRRERISKLARMVKDSPFCHFVDTH